MTGSPSCGCFTLSRSTILHIYTFNRRRAPSVRLIRAWVSPISILQSLPGWFFPVPPLAEQHRIVAKVEELMALCDQLESHLTTAQNETGRLLESVLHDALNETSKRAQTVFTHSEDTPAWRCTSRDERVYPCAHQDFACLVFHLSLCSNAANSRFTLFATK